VSKHFAAGEDGVQKTSGVGNVGVAQALHPPVLEGGGSGEAGIVHAAAAETAYTTQNLSESRDPFMLSQHETAQLAYRLNKHLLFILNPLKNQPSPVTTT